MDTLSDSDRPRTEPQRKPRPGDELLVRVESLDARGRAVGNTGDTGSARAATGVSYRVVMRRGLPGELVRARVRRRRKDRIEAERVLVLEPSPKAVPPRCRHFGVCGGCSFQDLEYAAQLELKRSGLERALRAVGLDPEVRPTIGCPEPFGYRNKMDFTCANRRWVEEGEPPGVDRDFALGLHVQGVWGKVLDVRSCDIQFPAGNALLASVRDLARRRGLEPWDTRGHTGLLRHLVLRSARTTGQILVDLVTSRDAPELVEPLAQELLALHPEITTIVQNVTSRPAQVAVGEYERILSGPGFIVERFEVGSAPLEFRISANSFFQTNTRQAACLLELVLAAAAVDGTQVVWDVYCGAGFFALALARAARAVVGFEQVAEAVRDAELNASRNGIENATFVAGDLAEVWSQGVERWPRPDVVVLDPPRAGLHPKVAAALAELSPPRIVWVSCNLDAALPDVARFVDAGYQLEAVQPVDLFPHTPHVESVFVLTLPEAPA